MARLGGDPPFGYYVSAGREAPTAAIRVTAKERLSPTLSGPWRTTSELDLQMGNAATGRCRLQSRVGRRAGFTEKLAAQFLSVFDEIFLCIAQEDATRAVSRPD